MAKETFIIDTNNDDLFHYYGEWHVSGELNKFLTEHDGKRLKITVEVLED